MSVLSSLFDEQRKDNYTFISAPPPARCARRTCSASRFARVLRLPTRGSADSLNKINEVKSYR
jgi:hypothetical protein